MADQVSKQHIDWEEIEGTPEFQELVRKRRSFVVPATIFFLAWYMGFILLAAYAEGFMSERIYEGLTVGYVLALTQFLMVLVLGITYLRRADKVYDPLAEKAIARYQHDDPASATVPAGRAARPGTDHPTTTGSRAATR
ncbi:MAG: DUF485 domain-containing protein [Actinomycetota bacterium]|nr:DUF485 domain-containing protein [Actinomycetota bacterium]